MAKPKAEDEKKAEEHPSLPLILERAVKRHNVLIGNDTAQVRFAERFLSAAHGCTVRHEAVERAEDHHLLGADGPRLLLVERAALIDLSPAVRAKTGVWSLDLLEKGSAGVNAIVRKAAALLGQARPERERVQAVADEIAREVYDIGAAVWQAAWVLTGPPAVKRRWASPWENWLAWLPRGEDPGYRLNALYWELVMWVFARSGDERGFRKTRGRFDKRRFDKLALLSLPNDRVFNSITELSRWRERGYDPYACALRISRLWRP